MAWNIDLPESLFFDNYSEDLVKLINEVKEQDIVSIDTETTGLNKMRDIPLFFSLAWGPPNNIKRAGFKAHLLPIFKEVFEDPTKMWVLANAKYDMHILKNVGLELSGQVADTIVMHALLYEDDSHALKNMSRQVLGWTWKGFEDTFGDLKKESPYEVLMRAYNENKDILAEYICNDAYGTLALFWKLDDMLAEAQTFFLADGDAMWQADRRLSEVFYKIEVPYTKVLWKCERRGARINTFRLAQKKAPIEKRMALLSQKIFKLTGSKLNPNSTNDIANYYNGLGVKPIKMTKGGKTGVKKPSYDESVLTRIADDGDPIAKLLLEYRGLNKLLGTYVEGLAKFITPQGRIHTKLNQHGTVTGRLSSSEPNLTNQPRAEDDEFTMREVFEPYEDETLLVADYKALEMRVLAALSREESMQDIFRKGWDIHMGNAALVFGLPYEDIVKAKKLDKLVKEGKEPEEALTDYVHKCLRARQDAKTIGFGLNYGMKEKALSRRLGCTIEEAFEKTKAYKNRYPAVDSFFNWSVDLARRTGFAFTAFGRRRKLDTINSSRPMDRWDAERKASNVPIQGTSADIVKIAMIAVENSRLESELGFKMFLQVHDELLLSGPKENLEEAKKVLKDCMENSLGVDLGVKFEVDIGSGSNWATAK